MTNAFTLLRGSYPRAKYTILYGMYYMPSFPPPNSDEDFFEKVANVPNMSYPYEVVNRCRTTI